MPPQRIILAGHEQSVDTREAVAAFAAFDKPLRVEHDAHNTSGTLRIRCERLDADDPTEVERAHAVARHVEIVRRLYGGTRSDLRLRLIGWNENLVLHAEQYEQWLREYLFPEVSRVVDRPTRSRIGDEIGAEVRFGIADGFELSVEPVP